MKFVSVAVATAVVAVSAEKVVPVFDKPVDNKVFEQVYDSFLKDFPVEQHNEVLAEIEKNVASYLSSRAFTGESNCDAAGAGGAIATQISAYPGGVTKRIFGMNLAKLVDTLASKAKGAAAAQGVFPGMLAMQALSSGAGLIKAAMSTVLQVVPRMIPPNQPLQCMPMVTGHNCLGAVQYPITTADFVNADVTDQQLDGVIAGFPALYKRKVGKTSDAAYKACFSAYMGMQCASIFPRCSVPQAGNEPGPTGRLPLCFTHCVATLVACPGFWVDDIMGECMMASVPPACTMSVFANYWLLPPQYASYEESTPSQGTCPQAPASLLSQDLTSNVYDTEIPNSPYA